MNKVENLQKVTLLLEAGTTPDVMDLDPQNPKFEFIFGLVPGGMTPFEYELVNRNVGQEVLLHLERAGLDSFFERLNPPIMDLFNGRNDVYLKVKIAAVAPANNRQIVKAMAEIANQEDRCGCGCGCG